MIKVALVPFTSVMESGHHTLHQFQLVARLQLLDQILQKLSLTWSQIGKLRLSALLISVSASTVLDQFPFRGNSMKTSQWLTV